MKTRVLKWLATQEVFTYKTSDRYRSGIPDLLILKNGLLIAIELKSSTGRVSKIQEYTLNQLSMHGAKIGVCRSLEEVKCMLS